MIADQTMAPKNLLQVTKSLVLRRANVIPNHVIPSPAASES